MATNLTEVTAQDYDPRRAGTRHASPIQRRASVEPAVCSRATCNETARAAASRSKRWWFVAPESGGRCHFDATVFALSERQSSAMSRDVVGGAERRQVRVIGVATARPLGLVVEIGVECEPVATVTGACAMREDQQQFEPDFSRNPLTRTSRFSPIWAGFIGGLHALSLVHTYDMMKSYPHLRLVRKRREAMQPPTPAAPRSSLRAAGAGAPPCRRCRGRAATGSAGHQQTRSGRVLPR